MVMPMPACPGPSEPTFTWTPSTGIYVAWEWRRPWKVTRGRPTLPSAGDE